ncbi:lipid-A-disaccharide synthase, partial [bacterium]|nr:lipid-A-disaccharide synthase [bacterium]
KKAYKVAYYIAPQVWAWKTNRVQKLKLYVDRLLCILPFEVDFFARHGLSVDYVGHPLLDAVKKLEKESAARDDESPIALIPGSRKQEIKKMLPTMLKTAKKFKYEKFVVTAAPAIEAAFYQSFDLPKNVALEVGKTHKIMRKAKAALVTSGTATLETALFNTPEVVCYKANALSVAIARRLIKVKYISLVNLIMDKPVVTELIQQDFNADKCADELNLILKQGPRQLQMLSEYRQLKEKLGNAGASNRAASLIFELAQL